MRIVGVTWTQLSNWSVVDVLSSVTLRGEAVSRRRVISIFVFTHFFFFLWKTFLAVQTLSSSTHGFCVTTFRGLFQRTDRELQPLSSDHAVNFTHLRKKKPCCDVKGKKINKSSCLFYSQ